LLDLFFINLGSVFFFFSGLGLWEQVQGGWCTTNVDGKGTCRKKGTRTWVEAATARREAHKTVFIVETADYEELIGD